HGQKNSGPRSLVAPRRPADLRHCVHHLVGIQRFRGHDRSFERDLQCAGDTADLDDSRVSSWSRLSGWDVTRHRSPGAHRRAKLKLHPLAAIFAVLVGGEIAGVIGVYLSIPIMAALRILWKRWSAYSEPTSASASVIAARDDRAA